MAKDDSLKKPKKIEVNRIMIFISSILIPFLWIDLYLVSKNTSKLMVVGIIAALILVWTGLLVTYIHRMKNEEKAHSDEQAEELLRTGKANYLMQKKLAEKIANTLNKNGVPAPILDKWKGGTIRSILTNPVYMGYIAYNRRKNGHANSTRLDRKEWTYSREQKPEIMIVSQEIWERAQEIREARKNKINASRQETNALYMEQYNVPFSTRGRLALTGMVYCGYCGKRLKNTGYANHWTCKKTGEKKVSYVGRYGCPEKCKQRSTYSQEYLEGIVFATVETYLENLKKIDISKELEEMQTQQGKTIKREIKDLEKEIKNLMADIETLEEKLPEAIRGEFAFSVDKLSAIISDKESLKKEKEIQKKSLQKQLEEISLQSNELMTFVEAMPKWNEIFSQADVQTKQMILSTLIDKIIVKDDDITIKFKIRLDNFLDEKLLESSGVDVPEQRL